MATMPSFFGFYGNGFSSLGDVIDKTQSFSNLNWLHGSESKDDLLVKLTKTKSNGQRAIIAVQELLFETPSTKLRSDAWQRLKDLQAALLPAWDTVEAILIFDEPYRSNKNNVGLSAQQVTANLNYASGVVKSVTTKAVAISAAGNEFDSYGVPAGVDWIGMYRYSYNTSILQLMFSYFNLLRMKRSGQKIIAVVDAFEWPGKRIDEGRINRFNATWKFLIKMFGGDVIGVTPFLYQTSAMGQGADAMPSVLSDLASWGREIKSSTV